MTINRWAKRVDANQEQIISALEAVGASVLIVGKPLDLLVGVPQSKKLAFFECKVKDTGKLTKAQLDFLDKWSAYPLFVVDSPEVAVAVYEEFAK